MKVQMIIMPLQLQLRLLLLVPLFCVSFAARNLGNEMATLDGTDNNNNNITSYRNNYCQLAQEVEQSNGTIELKDALNGVSLSVGSLSGHIHFFLYDDTTGLDPTYPGVNVRVMDYIAEQGNFTWRNTFGIIERNTNETVAELLERSVDKYDVVLGAFTTSTYRMNKYINFIDGHYDGSLILIRDVTEETTIAWFNWMKPFTNQTWLLILGIVVFSALSYQIIEWIGGRRDHTTATMSWFSTNCYLSFMNFTGNHIYEPSNFGGQIFCFFTAFWAMLITATYTANLASELVSRTGPPIILTDVDHAITLGMKICVFEGSYSEKYMKETYPENIPLLIPVPELDNMFLPLTEGRCDVLIGYQQDFDTSQKSAKLNPTCSFQHQGRIIKNSIEGFATKEDTMTKCTDLVNAVFDYYIREMEDQGIVTELWDEHENHYGSPDHCAVDDDVESEVDEDSDAYDDSLALTPQDMAGTMLWQVVGSLIAIIVAYVSRRKLDNKQHDDKKNSNNIDDTDTNLHDNQIDELAKQMKVMTKMMETIIETQTAQQQQQERKKENTKVCA